MVKSVLSVTHAGLKDWMIQRLSALIMFMGLLALLAYFLVHPHISFDDWSALFKQMSVKVFSLLVIVAALYHTWIGMWTIYTDYIKPPVLRLLIDVLTLLFLFAALIWSVMILGSV